MAGPLCLLYEVGIWLAWIFGKKPKEPAKGPDMEKKHGGMTAGPT